MASNKKSKVYSSKFAAIFSLILISLFIIIETINVYSLISSIIYQNDILFEIIMIIVFLPFIILLGFVANRFGYLIVYDSINNTLSRRGLICGYKFKIRVDDIQNIIIATFPKETTYYVIIDPYNTKYDGGSKKSFIRIEKNEKNLKFIAQFWDKPIKNN